MMPGVAGRRLKEPGALRRAQPGRRVAGRMGASLLWVAQPSGSVVLRQWAFTAPVATLKAQFISRDSVLPPTKTRTLVHQRNHRVHGDGEISAALLATDVNYSDGTSVNALRPAEAGANVTETRTAAAIVGQGTGATANSLSQLDASAGVAVQRAIQQFVSFVNASAITAGYNSFAKNSSTIAAATSAAYPGGVSFRFRALNLSAAYAVLLTPNANDSSIYAGGDYGVYFTGGNQMRLIVNGVTEIVGATSSFEELAFNYDSQTGVLEWWRGQQLIRSVTLATGLTLYASFRPTNSTTAAIENVRIEPYSAILRRINSVEAGATVTIGEGSLNRNGFFDLVDSIGNLLAWSVTSGAPLVRTASSEATKGSYGRPWAITRSSSSTARSSACSTRHGPESTSRGTTPTRWPSATSAASGLTASRPTPARRHSSGRWMKYCATGAGVIPTRRFAAIATCRRISTAMASWRSMNG